MIRARHVATAVLSLTVCVVVAADDKEDGAARPASPAGPPTLNAEQQSAVGIVVARPVEARGAERIEALGEVLDVSALIADLGESTSAAAAAHAAEAESQRLKTLYQGGAGASLKMLEAAEAERVRAHAQAQAADARLTLRFGPLMGMAAGEREALLGRAAAGRSLLVRADIPGRHALGVLPDKALIDVDGVSVAGRVLGAARQTGEVQGASLLIDVPRAPEGLGVGARIPVTLSGAPRKGVALPGEAVLYDQGGAYVFKRLGADRDSKSVRYQPIKIELLERYGNGWLVDGVDHDDDIVVRGAGVLWSLQDVGTRPADDDDD